MQKTLQTTVLLVLGLTHLLVSKANCSTADKWQFNPFVRVDKANPILTSNPNSSFQCPVQNKKIKWEAEHVFNPAAVVHKGKVYLFYRAEDNYGKGIGHHTSRIGLAVSKDGIHFKRMDKPVLFPNTDEQKKYEFPGGCEDPRIVEKEDGTFIMMYTQWDREIATLSVATSKDLLNWEKQGYVFKKQGRRRWSKSGSIVCRQEGNRLVATKINGKYWMYWGEGHIYIATSNDLINWEYLRDEDNWLLTVLKPRKGKFDSLLVEPGPPAILTKQGIVLLYNGKNSVRKGDPAIAPQAYSAGQALFDAKDPTKVLDRGKKHFLTPEKPYEMKGQYKGGTVFIQGLVYFQDKWFLYYGSADSAIGVAISQ